MRDRLKGIIDNWDKTDPLADHLLKNGVIVPPCKFGDRLYMLVTRRTRTFEIVNGEMKHINNQHTFVKLTYLSKSNFFNVLENFGKTVFLTKEEAEKALRGEGE